MTSDTELHTPMSPHAGEPSRAGPKQCPTLDNLQHTANELLQNPSRLMRLPQEVKREIYLLLLGNREIYIAVRNVRTRANNGWLTKNRMRRVVREAGWQELSRKELFVFSLCPRPSENNRVSLAILRASRQNYDEAHLLPYTNNTFRMDVETLELFMDGRLSYQKQSLRSLSLRISVFELHHETYYECLMFKAARSLIGLRRFKMLVDIAQLDDNFDLTYWTVGMMVWGIRKLDNAEVAVKGDAPSNLSAWKLSQLKEIAGKLSKALSDRTLMEKHRQIAMMIQDRPLARRFQKRLQKSLGSNKS